MLGSAGGCPLPIGGLERRRRAAGCQLDHLCIRQRGQLGRRAGQDREGGVVNWDHGPHSAQRDGTGGTTGAHGVVPADGQHADGGAPIADQGHVTEQVRVAGVVDLRPVLELDEPAPAADLAGDLVLAAGHGHPAAVLGAEHGELDAGGLHRAAAIHADGLHAAAGQVHRQLVAAKDRCPAGGKLHHIGRVVADVVEVAVSGRHDVHALGPAIAIGVGRCAGPAVDPQPALAGRAVQHAAVSQPGDAQPAHRMPPIHD
jgi:hypothetical protein